MARLSRVRHQLSLVLFARFQTTTWSWNWGSPARQPQWVKEVAITPLMSSSTTPAVPEQE